MLTLIIIIGVGADDTFILVKTWSGQQAKMLKSPKATISNCSTNANDEPNRTDQSYVEGKDEEIGVNSEGIYEAELSEADLIWMVKSTLKHSILTISVTSLTTSVAFLASLVSNVTAIKCFR